MQTIKKVVGLILLLMVALVAVELSYRFYILGPIAFDPIKVNSMNTIMRSEYVQLSEYPDIFFELKPDMRGPYKGVDFWTDSNGRPDREYARAKPDNTFRIAVAGSSWEMPTGVSPDKAWHAVLEEKLNSRNSDPQFEVINFGVEMYGLREILGTVRHKILEWDPDLILVGVTTYTTSLVWEPVDKPQVLPPRTYPALLPFSLGVVKRYLGIGTSPVQDRKSLGNGQVDERMAQLRRALNELGEISRQNGVPIVIVFLDFFQFPVATEADIAQTAQQAGVSAVFANHVFPADFEQREPYQVSIYEPHPSEAGHVLIADFVGEALLEKGLLPRN